MTDQVYIKLRYSELELLLIKKLKEAHNALELIASRGYESSANSIHSGAPDHIVASETMQRLEDCEQYAQNVAYLLYNDLGDEECDVLSQI
ncbi:MAG: hypothetical protein HC836_35645 [Richelia sp. RM2_1_2]|nr:hypothetical protein [Richelia sp. RM2_1_2]